MEEHKQETDNRFEKQSGRSPVRLEKVMIKALKGIGRNGTVIIGKKTASAGEILAAILIYDYYFKRVGPQTAGALSDGSFLSVRTSKNYITPGGHKCSKTYL